MLWTTARCVTELKLDEEQVRVGREIVVKRMLEFEVYEEVDEQQARGKRIWNGALFLFFLFFSFSLVFFSLFFFSLFRLSVFFLFLFSFFFLLDKSMLFSGHSSVLFVSPSCSVSLHCFLTLCVERRFDATCALAMLHSTDDVCTSHHESQAKRDSLIMAAEQALKV